MPKKSQSLSIRQTHKTALQLTLKYFLFIYTTIFLCNLSVPLLLNASGKLFSTQPEALIIRWGEIATTNPQNIFLLSHVLTNNIWQFLCFALVPAMLSVRIYDSYTTGTTQSYSSYMTKTLCALPGLLILQLISTAITCTGLILLILPGLIVAAMLSCAMPIYLIEGKGIIQSLKNSRKLTTGYKTDIIFLWISAVIVFMIMTPVISAIQDKLELHGMGIGMAALTHAYLALLATYGFSLNFAIYILLRKKRDQAMEEAVSAIAPPTDVTDQLPATR